MPAAVGHWWPAMAPAPAFSTVGPTVRSATIGPWAGARSAIVSFWATMGVRPMKTESHPTFILVLWLLIYNFPTAALKDRRASTVFIKWKSHVPGFWPGARPRLRVGAFFRTGRWPAWGTACRLPRAPWTHTPGCRARLLNEPHTPTHLSSASMRGQNWEMCLNHSMQ